MQNAPIHPPTINRPERIPTPLILHQNITRISKKFSTSGWFYSIESINKFFSKRRNSSKAVLRQCEFDKERQVMQKYYGESGRKEMSDLVQYYKYYTQLSITYDRWFFKVMHFHREKKKLLEYNRLKIALNLSQDTLETSTERDKKNDPAGNLPFKLLSQIIFTSSDNQESILIQKLKIKLEKQLGPNRHKTIEDLDKNYKFQKKITEPTISTIKKESFPTKKSQYKYKEYAVSNQLLKTQKMKKKRNNSCQSLITHTNRKQERLKSNGKGHRKSITTLYSPPKSTQQYKYNHTPTSSSKLSSKCLTKKYGAVLVKTKQRYDDKIEEQIKYKIIDIKDQINKEKNMLKKKIVSSFMAINSSISAALPNKIKTIKA